MKEKEIIIQGFENYLRSEGYRLKTTHSNCGMINRYLCWVYAENMDYTGITYRDLLAYMLAHYPRVLSVYVAYVEGVPASTGWIIFPEGSVFGGLWGGSTLSQYRGRGLYTALLAIRAQEARGRGVRYLTVDASPMSRPILEKFGFQAIAFAYACKMKFG